MLHVWNLVDVFWKSIRRYIHELESCINGLVVSCMQLMHGGIWFLVFNHVCVGACPIYMHDIECNLCAQMCGCKLHHEGALLERE